jgi:ERCC4-related helicase
MKYPNEATKNLGDRLEHDQDIGPYLQEQAMKSLQVHLGNREPAIEELAEIMKKLLYKWNPVAGLDNFYDELMALALDEIDYHFVAKIVVNKTYTSAGV